ncbi:50S ribosomal protein L6 [Candidatus Uhrbacteria bacterium CG10_big_fil_rev_8_21_14_0_10_48_11]|uniref:Large ribosomal subunit protein uL6 n=1 Tax=Candidatus Uhrbacteria bacterium CG10_big_fil_rev_8_21_14_0_10_48_11 TaxID=1975037 RepID=A0A2M8LEZ5_9BACT|nr:MAG: 50S ribosomal protein L6 [Candidatus Uhrbacteria bacterium CG10_big_fil_rev_8_21_14_0_10_48_11]
MSRIGKQPIIVPSGVTVDLDRGKITVKGSRGELSAAVHPSVRVAAGENELTVTVTNPEGNAERALWGLWRSLINNMVIGVTQGFTKQMELVGVGYKVAVAGSKLTLHLGFSHPIELTLPDGVKGEVEKNVLTLTGIDKQLVGETAARIRRLRKPEPYKGKGIKYVGEILRRKAGKAAKSSE